MNRMLERLDKVAFTNNDIDFDDTEFDSITIHFFNNNSDEDHPANIGLVPLIACRSSWKRCKACKKKTNN